MQADVPVSLHGLTPAIVQEARKPSMADEPMWTWTTIAEMPNEHSCDPRILCTVLSRTRAVGWPHKASVPEKIEITSAVLHRLARGASGAACSWPDGTPARTLCTVVRKAGKPRVVRVRVKVWEDGSYRFTKMGGK